MITGRFVYHGSTGHTGSDGQGVPVPERHWLRKLLLLPVFAVAGILGVFFFTAFLVLSVLLIAGLGARFWWLRRQLHQSMAASGSLYREEAVHSGPESKGVVEGEYVVLTTECNADTGDAVFTPAEDDTRICSQSGKQNG